METPELHRLSGYILELSESGFGRAQFAASDGVSEHASLATNWQRYKYESAKPVLAEDVMGTPAPYVYPIICRWGRERLLMLSSHRRVVEAVLADFIRPKWPAASRRTPIKIQSLVEAITHTGTPYRLTTVSARTAGFGDDLRSISFYGTNVSQAQMFRETLPQLDCYLCGIRFPTDGAEIARLGTNGFLSFALPFGAHAAKRLKDVEEIVGFLRKGGFLGWGK